MTIRPTGAQLELLIIAQLHAEGAPWPPPDRLRRIADPLIAAGLLVREDDRVVLSVAGEAVIHRDDRAAELREELTGSEAAPT